MVAYKWHTGGIQVAYKLFLEKTTRFSLWFFDKGVGMKTIQK